VAGISGWKLHLSFNADNLEAYILLLLNLHARTAVPFKIIQSVDHLVAQSDGVYGETQIGKCATIYPADGEQLAEVFAYLTDNQPATLYEGPDVNDDIKIGRNIYARYGQFNPILKTNQMGLVEAHIPLPDGSVIMDGYDHDRNVALWKANDMLRSIPIVDRERRSGPSAITDDLYRSVLTLKRKAGASVFSGIGQTDGSKWAIKEACRGIKSDQYGRDARSRLTREAEALRRLASTGFVPEARAIVGEADRWFLATRWIEGKTLFAMIRAEKCAQALSASGSGQLGDLAHSLRLDILATFRTVLRQLDIMHSLGVFHRDLTPHNILVEEGTKTPFFIDFEIAYFADDKAPPFLGGTEGYGLFAKTVSEASDPFADHLAVLNAVLFHLSGVEPKLLQPSWDIEAWKGWCRTYGANDAVWPLVSGLQTAASHRESALRDELPAFIGALQSQTAPRSFAGSDRMEIVRAGTRTLASPALLSKETRLWFSEDDTSVKTGRRVLSPTLYDGLGGILYYVSQIASVEGLNDEVTDIATRAGGYLIDIDNDGQVRSSGLYFGWTGVLLGLLSARHAKLVTFGEVEILRFLKRIAESRNDWLDVTHGEAGVILGLLDAIDLIDCTETNARRAVQDVIRSCAGHIAESQLENGGWRSPIGVSGMSGQRFFGYAHGTAGIAAAMLATGLSLGNSQFVERAERAAHLLVRKSAYAASYFALPISEDIPQVWNWWCHGNAGAAPFLFAIGRATGNPTFEQAGRDAMWSSAKAFEYDNVSVCHGMAGVAMSVMDMYALSSDRSFLDLAGQMSDRLAHIRQLGSPAHNADTYWRVEARSFETAGLMKGQAGILLCLLRHAVGPLQISGLPGSNFLTKTLSVKMRVDQQKVVSA
jgi:tRNA A-37 threonylcarbamoyl transferase component Bud32